MTYYELARDLHIAFGSVALIAFWITAAVRKGTAAHTFNGRIYVVAIMAVIATALPLAIHAFAVGQSVLGLFLAYLVLVTGSAVWGAWRAIRHRASISTYIGGAYRPLAWGNLLAGGVILAVGVCSRVPLLLIMSAVGIFSGYQQLRFAARLSPERHWWLRRHYTGIVGSGVATHIAFLNLGLSRVIPDGYSGVIMYCGWLAPLLTGLAAVAWLNRVHGSAPTPIRAGDLGRDG